MSIEVQCPCGRILKARDEFAGKRGECRYCGHILSIPEGTPGQAAASPRPAAPGGLETPLEITEFLDPPSRPPAPDPRKKPTISMRQMFEALLDPRSIQWMLILGGGLAVLGLIVWLTSLGIFENKVVLAVALAVGAMAILGAGWGTVLKTRYRIAGQAITFLGCVVLPLNLWFLHAQNLVTLENHLWIGGVLCCLLYVATVYVLRDPLFLYAVEAGITLTVALFLSELNVATDTSWLAMVLMALGLISIHAERSFPPEGQLFDRKRFGLPLFWSGHVQIAAGLLVLLGTQVVGLLIEPKYPLRQLVEIQWPGNWLTEYYLLAGGLWLAGMYAYLYSDLVVRRVGVYVYLAAFCLIMAEVTMAGRWLEGEGLIATLALTAMAANLAQTFLAAPNDKISRAVPPLALGLSALPILIGIGLHIRATSAIAAHYQWTYATGWPFVIVMLVVAVCNRISAHLFRKSAPAWSAAYFFGSAAAAIVAAAGFLRMVNLTHWSHQAPLLMLIPIAYIVAGRLYRGHTAERPLGWVAHAAAAVLLLHVLVGAMEIVESVVQPRQQSIDNLLLGLVFAEAAVFYTLAAIFRRRGVNVYFATAAACGALWQFLGYFGVPGPYHTMLYAVLGVEFLVVCRVMGIEQLVVYRPTGEQGLATRGRGLAAFQVGDAILSLALLAAAIQGLMRLSAHAVSWTDVWALVVTTLASFAAIGLAPGGTWRRVYVTSTIALAGVTFLTLNVLSTLTGWQKLEIFCVLIGTILIGASYVGRFRETSEREDEMVTAGLWLGSILATVPLVVAVLYHRFPHFHVSLLDELGLVTLTVLMLVTGFSWQIKSTTFFGGAALTLYLIIVIVALGWQQQLAVGVYLAIGGTLVFALGVTLSVYRDRLLALPEQIAKREGVFRVLNWR